MWLNVFMCFATGAIVEREDDKIDEEIKVLYEKFRSLIKSIRSQLESQKKSIDEVHDTLLMLPQPLHKVYSPMLNEKFHSLEKCGSHREFFFKLQDCWNFIDFDLLEIIINDHGSDKLKADMKKYLKELSKFCKSTSVYQLINMWKPKYELSDIPDNHRKYVAQLDQNPETCTIQELESLRNDTTSPICCAQLSKAALIFFTFSGGSVTVVWIIEERAIDMLSSCITQLLNTNDVKFFSQYINRYKILLLLLDDFMLFPHNCIEQVNN